MTKKISSILLIVLILFSLASCGEIASDYTDEYYIQRADTVEEVSGESNLVNSFYSDETENTSDETTLQTTVQTTELVTETEVDSHEIISEKITSVEITEQTTAEATYTYTTTETTFAPQAETITERQTEAYQEVVSEGASVWIPTNGGTKYHITSTCSKMQNPRYVSIDEAVRLGFSPCKRCYK